MVGTMTSHGDQGGGNAIAEKRRQRKLENQRLEAEARKRQEDLRLQKERELKRQEDERIAAEQRALDEIEQVRRKREAELARIATIEANERNRVLAIERKLKLIGAFCVKEATCSSTGSDGSNALPLCCAVLTLSSLENPIAALDENVVFVGDTSCHINVHRFRDLKLLFRIVIEYGVDGNVSITTAPPTSLATTRSGHLLVGNAELSLIGVYDINQLVMTYYNSLTASSRGIDTVVKASPALVATFSFQAVTSTSTGGRGVRIRGVCVDDTASELFVSDQTRHGIHVLSFNPAAFRRENQGAPKAKSPITVVRSFGSKGHGRGQLHKPGGLDVSHYHVLVCDRGNSRVVAFTKRGVFVCSFGAKGSAPGQFMDPRDVKVANVRKRAISRGVPMGDDVISSEQFDMIVADQGNFRVQILNEAGEFRRVLSLLSGLDQIHFHQDFIAKHYAQLLEYYASIGLTLPLIDGSDVSTLFKIAEHIHPSNSLYQKITHNVAVIRQDSARFHHPLNIAYAAREGEVVVVDRRNGKIFSYNVEGSRSVWTSLPVSAQSERSAVCKGLSSSHTTILIEDELFVSDPMSHRIAVLRYPTLEFSRFIGATTYGDQALCSEGFLPGELRFPTCMTTYLDGNQVRLLVSDTGNNAISVFDPQSGEFHGRVGRGFGHIDGYLESPQGLAVYDNRWLYVCDQLNHRVQVFDLTTREFIRRIGQDQGSAPGEFSFPSAVAVCSALRQVPSCNFGPYRDAKFCVGESGNHRIQVFNMEDDRVLYIIDTSHTPFEQPMLPVAITYEDKSSYMIATDMNNRSVAVFRHDGTFVAAFGSNLEPENCFQRPTGLVLTPQKTADGAERVFITDAVRMAICTFELRAVAPEPAAKSSLL